MSNSVLITGVAGLLGSRLADWIIENKPDVKVVGIDDFSGGYRENVNPKVDLRILDLAKGDIGSVFRSNSFSHVFHFAAYAAEGLSPFIRCFNYDNNLRATANIINWCIKADVERLVFTSSLAIYGHGYGGIFDEDQIPKPIDPYGVAKFACEMDIQIAGEQHDLDWCIIRPHNVYGIKQNIWDKYRNVLGIWMYQHLNKEQMTIFGDGEQTRAFTFIDDILEPLWEAATSWGASKQIINLGGTKEICIKSAANILRDVIGTNKGFKYLEKRHEVKHSIPTFQKSIDLLGYEHKTTMEDGLTQMWNWAKEQPMKPRFKWRNYEIDKGIYSFWR